MRFSRQERTSLVTTDDLKPSWWMKWWSRLCALLQWFRTDEGTKWLKWGIVPILISLISSLTGYNVHQDPHIALVHDVVFESCAIMSKDGTYWAYPFFAPSPWLCLATIHGKPAPFFDRDEGDKRNSTNFAALINANPAGPYTVIASGERNTNPSNYPNIWCLFLENKVIEPSDCLEYPVAAGTQI